MPLPNSTSVAGSGTGVTVLAPNEVGSGSGPSSGWSTSGPGSDGSNSGSNSDSERSSSGSKSGRSTSQGSVSATGFVGSPSEFALATFIPLSAGQLLESAVTISCTPSPEI